MNELSQVTVILRGYTYEQVYTVCKVIEGSSIQNVEITTNSPGVFETVKEIKENFTHLNVGVGTVLNMDHAKAAVEAQADFILSPILLSDEIIKYCIENNVTCVTAAFSASEIYKAMLAGASVIKIFPANSLAKSYAKDVKAPLGNVDLMAVGGVGKENAKEYLNGGYKYLGIGSGIFKKEDIEDMNEERLRKSLEEFEIELRG